MKLDPAAGPAQHRPDRVLVPILRMLFTKYQVTGASGRVSSHREITLRLGHCDNSRHQLFTVT